MANINAGDASGRWGGTLSENQLSTYTTLEDKIQEEREKRLAKMREKSNKELSEKQIKLVDDLIRKEFRLRERLDTEARQKNLTEDIKVLKTLNALESDAKEKERRKDEIHQKKMEKLRLWTQENLVKSLENTLNSAVDAIKSSLGQVDQAMSSYTKYVSTINARIQGSTKTFTDLSSTVRSNIGISPFVSQQKVMENMANMIDQGILYNVEQRAFLQTIAKDIATTFNAANGTLLQLIRIQQADTTAARLGMEASLTQFLNRNFMDTSYLSNGYSTTQGALLQSSALYENYKDAIEFEYNVQKWLGTFGSVGVQQSTLQSLAQGINYLGTGNITGLQGNQSLLNLMTFAASQSGLNLIDMMNRGINAKEANKLLSAIVSFGQNIGQTGSRVAMSQYAEMFGLDVSDIVALSNLTQTDISNILGTNLTYSGAMGELGSQLKQVGKRQHLAQQIDNVIDNLVYTTAGGIADNVGMYTTWRVASLLGDVLGDAFSIPVPLVGKISIEDTIKAGLAGASLGMGLIGQVGASISKGELSMSNWGASETLSRGEGKTQVVGGASRTLSQSGFIGTTDSEGVQNVFEEQARKDTQAKMGEERTINYANIVDENGQSLNMTSIVDNVKAIYELLNTGVLTVNVANVGSLSELGY